METLPSVGRGLPRLTELAHSVSKYQWIFPGIHGLLIEHVGMVAMVGMPHGIFQHRAAHGEAALLGNHQDISVFSAAPGKQEQQT